MKNAYLHGFCMGIREVLEKQGSALMTIIPKEVEESWKGMEGQFCCKENTLRTAKDGRAYGEGKISGRAAVSSRGIDG